MLLHLHFTRLIYVNVCVLPVHTEGTQVEHRYPNWSLLQEGKEFTQEESEHRVIEWPPHRQQLHQTQKHTEHTVRTLSVHQLRTLTPETHSIHLVTHTVSMYQNTHDPVVDRYHLRARVKESFLSCGVWVCVEWYIDRSSKISVSEWPSTQTACTHTRARALSVLVSDGEEAQAVIDNDIIYWNQTKSAL